MNRKNRKSAIFLSFLLLVLIFSACRHYVHTSPRHGKWKTADDTIVICYEDTSESFIVYKGIRVNCIVGNPHGSKKVWFEAASDIQGVCKKGEYLLEGETVLLNDNEWVIRIEGIDYHLQPWS